MCIRNRILGIIRKDSKNKLIFKWIQDISAMRKDVIVTLQRSLKEGQPLLSPNSCMQLVHGMSSVRAFSGFVPPSLNFASSSALRKMPSVLESNRSLPTGI